jgi:hypothetical protein
VQLVAVRVQLHRDPDLGALLFKLGRSGQADDEFRFPAPGGGLELEASPGSQFVLEKTAIGQPVFQFLGFKITGRVNVDRLAASAVEGFTQIIYDVEGSRLLPVIHFHVIEKIAGRRAMARGQKDAGENNRAE